MDVVVEVAVKVVKVLFVVKAFVIVVLKVEGVVVKDVNVNSAVVVDVNVELEVKTTDGMMEVDTIVTLPNDVEIKVDTDVDATTSMEVDSVVYSVTEQESIARDIATA